MAAPVAAPVAVAAGQENEEEDDVDALKKQVEELTRTVAATQQTTKQMEQSTKVSAAIEAWKLQASPAELAMADVLIEAKNPDELKLRAEVIKRAVATREKDIDQERQRIEREMQAKFGLPVTPTFQPIPEKEKMEAALADGDIEKAASIALKGIFTT